jgi:hypothetical protein
LEGNRARSRRAACLVAAVEGSRLFRSPPCWHLVGLVTAPDATARRKAARALSFTGSRGLRPPFLPSLFAGAELADRPAGIGRPDVDLKGREGVDFASNSHKFSRIEPVPTPVRVHLEGRQGVGFANIRRRFSFRQHRWRRCGRAATRLARRPWRRVPPRQDWSHGAITLKPNFPATNG